MAWRPRPRSVFTCLDGTPVVASVFMSDTSTADPPHRLLRTGLLRLPFLGLSRGRRGSSACNSRSLLDPAGTFGTRHAGICGRLRPLLERHPSLAQATLLHLCLPERVMAEAAVLPHASLPRLVFALANWVSDDLSSRRAGAPECHGGRASPCLQPSCIGRAAYIHVSAVEVAVPRRPATDVAVRHLRSRARIAVSVLGQQPCIQPVVTIRACRFCPEH